MSSLKHWWPVLWLIWCHALAERWHRDNEHIRWWQVPRWELHPQTRRPWPPLYGSVSLIITDIYTVKSRDNDNFHILVYRIIVLLLGLTVFHLIQANSGKDTNGCQFFITCAKCDFLDGKHVVFGITWLVIRSITDCLCPLLGRIIDGLLVMRKIENVPSGANNKPKIPVVISQCGEMWPNVTTSNHLHFDQSFIQSVIDFVSIF